VEGREAKEGEGPGAQIFWPRMDPDKRTLLLAINFRERYQNVPYLTRPF